MNKKNNDDDNNFDYDTINQKILNQAILLKMTSEIRALNNGIIPKMDFEKSFCVIEPKWNEKHTNQILGRALRKSKFIYLIYFSNNLYLKI